MYGHDHFLELGALATIGQISQEEDRELTAHLQECGDCRSAYSDYASITRNHLPNANPARFHLKNDLVHPSSPDEIRERFLARAQADGARFSVEVDARRPPKHLLFRGTFHGWRLLWAGSALVLASVATWAIFLHKPVVFHTADKTAQLRHENDALRDALRHAQLRSSPVIAPNREKEQLKSLQSKVIALAEQLDSSKHRVQLLETNLTQLQIANISVVGQNQRDQQAEHELQVQLAQERTTSAANLAALVEAQDKIRSLTAAVNDASQRVMMEQQLSAVSSDIRQLMGARNLHIIDVHDVNASGKTGRSFGRVFYAENRSLVFYAFDLPSSKSTKYYFQAWGQTEGNEHSLRNLGTFSVDDHEQHRWVLKVSNFQLLRGIDSVFVTAETVGDAPIPKGNRVLYAFFVGQPNHP